MTDANSRLTKERQTVEAMIRLYCRGRHGSAGQLCGECAELLDYASERFALPRSVCARRHLEEPDLLITNPPMEIKP